MTLNPYSYETASDIRSICSPLLQHQISYFFYAKIYDDQTINFLSTNPELGHNHFKKNFPVLPEIGFNLIKDQFYFLPTPSNQHADFNPAVHEFRCFDVDNTIFFIERQNDHFELSIFASTNDNHEIINFYINHVQKLNLFRLYFREKSHRLITNGDKNKLNISDSMYKSVNKIKSVIKKNKQDSISAFPKGIILNLQNGEIKITEREVECLQFYIKGETSKEIANNLNLSPRTIETHINNIKHKLMCTKRSEIINLISKYFPSNLNLNNYR